MLSYRRLWVLIKHLPADSWTQTALRDASSSGLEDLVKPELEPTFGPWSLTNYQLAALRDEVASVRYAVVRTTPGGEDYPPPPPTPMPGQRPKRVQSDANIRYLNKLRAIG